MGQIDKAKLRAFRKQLRLSQAEMARYFGVERSTYANWEAANGAQAMPNHQYAVLYSLGFKDVAGESPIISGPMIPVTYPTFQMPYAGYLPAGQWGDPMDSEDFEEVEAAHFKKGRFCARIAGDSCHPALQREDFTIWEHHLNPPFGKIVVAQRKDDHSATVKVLEWDANENRPRLRPVNPAFNDAEADGWGAVAMLVYVRWEDDEGGTMGLYRPEGIKPSQLLRYRS